VKLSPHEARERDPPFNIVTISLATFIVVFNLNPLIHHLGRFYNFIRQLVVKNMAWDPHETWATLARRLQRFQPGQNEPPPSELLVVLYACILPVNYLRYVFAEK